jgi:hypothetical protein
MTPSRTRRNLRRERRQRFRPILWPWLAGPFADIWWQACAAFAYAVDVAGTPAEVAHRDWLARADRNRIRDLVRHLEAFVRRLIVAMAMMITPSQSRARASRPRRRRRVLIWMHRPQSWIARLVILPGACGSATHAKRRPPRLGAPSFPLALRLEAVRRVLANPLARARRFAHALHRRRSRDNQPLPLKPVRRPRILNAGWTAGWRLTAEPIESLDYRIAHGVWRPDPQPG